MQLGSDNVTQETHYL